MADNGGGNGGGNTSVYWEIRHGKGESPTPPGQYAGLGPAPRGQVKVHSIVEGHSNDEFDDIGRPDHPGLFKVTLRYRDVDWQKVPANERQWIEDLERAGNVEHANGNRLVTLHVPAIKRTWPTNGVWGDMPWEIHWEW